MKNIYTIGIDIGGTKTSFGLISQTGNIIFKFTEPTETIGGNHLLTQIEFGIKKLLVKSHDLNAQVIAIGIGSPGRVSIEEGKILDCTPNIKNWAGIEVKVYFEKIFKLPIFIDNDANVAAFGEFYIRKLEGKKEETFVFLTIGTGLGSGVIYKDNLFRGKASASEIGHMILQMDGRQCNCGQKGCFEMYVSGVALETQAKNRLKDYSSSKLNSLDENNLKSHKIFEFAKDGDEFAQILINEFIKGLSNALISLVNIFEPDIILLGGGISKQKDMFLEKTLELVENNINIKNFNANIIQIAKTVENAGIIGAGLIAFHGYNEGDI